MHNNELLERIFKKPDSSKTIDSFAPDKGEPIRLTAHEIEILQIDQIKFVEGIGDYPESQSLHPSACRTELGDYCIDDACKIAREKGLGLAEIKCEVFTLSGHSDLDLKIRKTTRRTMPTAGRAPFYQIAVNVRKCFDLLVATSEILIIFGQGGDRMSDKFIGDRENDVRLILRARCGRGPDSVNAYLNATEYVTSEIQEYLFQEEATKSFCDYIRKDKTSLVTKLQSLKLTKEIISGEVSKAVKDWYPQHKATGTILPYTSTLLSAPKTSAAAKAAPASSTTVKVTGPSKRSKKSAPAPPQPPPPPANTGAGPAPVIEPAILELADDLNKNSTDLNSLAETMKGVTDEGLKAAFFFDFIAAKNSIEDVFKRIAEHFNFGKDPEGNDTEVV